MKPSLVPMFGLLLLLAIAPADQPARAATPVDPAAAVENGLRPAVTIEGDQPWTLQERMEHYGVPGVSLAVIHDFDVVWTKTYGLADRQTGDPTEPTTLFQAGSISKPVTAFGALLMTVDGRLDLDANVNDALKSWHLPDNEFTAQKPVTLSHLLSHTGGLTVHGFPGYAVGEPLPALVQVLDGEAPANTPAIRVDKAPGESWRYSGGGYTIAQQMMIDAAGQPLPALMAKLVLEPIGMTHSTYQQPLPPNLLQHAAAGVLPDGSDVEGKRHTYPEMAAAGLWTTAEDLALFAVEVQQALRGQGRVMNAATAALMVEPVDEGYGRGFGLERRDGARYFSHGGWDEGFCAQLTAHLDAGYGVAVMINSNHPAFLDEVVRSVAFAYGWDGYHVYDKLAVPEVALRQYTGRYRYNAELAVTIFRDGKRFFLQYVGGEPEELLYVGDDRFMRRERTAPITFTTEGGAHALNFVLNDGGLQTHPALADDEKLPRELLAEGEFDAAVAAYRALLEADTETQEASEGYLNSRGLDALDTNVDHGIAILRVATELYPDSANTWDSLGFAYREAGDREQAIRFYRMALERDPDFPSALHALAELESM